MGLVIDIAICGMFGALGGHKKKGLSLRDFEAHDNAIDSAQLSRFENGEKVPMIYTLYKIATVLEVDIADFFKSK
jgi:transcriptional regulator with XRE-family HTH domain